MIRKGPPQTVKPPLHWHAPTKKAILPFMRFSVCVWDALLDMGKKIMISCTMSPLLFFCTFSKKKKSSLFKQVIRFLFLIKMVHCMLMSYTGNSYTGNCDKNQFLYVECNQWFFLIVLFQFVVKYIDYKNQFLYVDCNQWFFLIRYIFSICREIYSSFIYVIWIWFKKEKLFLKKCIFAIDTIRYTPNFLDSFCEYRVILIKKI